MTPTPSRRALLAGLGTAALAGCLGRRRGTATGDAPATTDGATTTGETPTSTDGATPTPVAPDSVDTDWPMPAADPGRSSYVADAEGPTEQVAELWRVPTAATPSAPVVADGRLYVGAADGTVLALDARDGTKRWRTNVGAAADAPSVVGDTVYVPTVDAVVALAAADGSERWRTVAPAERDTLVADHGVYWVADATVVALDGDDGAERWRTDLRDPWEPHLFASPGTVFVSSGVHGPAPWRLAPATGAVEGDEPGYGHDFPRELFYRDGVRYGLDPFFENVQALPLDGTTGWTQGLPPQEVAALAGGGEQVYFVGASADASGLYALDDADGSVAWTNEAVTSFRGRPVVAGACVLVRSDAALHCAAPGEGTERWRLAGDAVGSHLAVADDLVFATGSSGVQALRPP